MSLDNISARIADAKLPTCEQRLAGVPLELPHDPVDRARVLFCRAWGMGHLNPSGLFDLALASLKDCGLTPKTKQEEL
jgi:hypothetical protein